jgi:hypothetical protein
MIQKEWPKRIAKLMAESIYNIKECNDDERDQIVQELCKIFTVKPCNESTTKELLTQSVCERIVYDFFFTRALVPRDSECKWVSKENKVKWK